MNVGCETASTNGPAKCCICFAVWVLSLLPLSPAHSSGSSQESLGCSGLLLSWRRQSFQPGIPASKPSCSWDTLQARIPLWIQLSSWRGFQSTLCANFSRRNEIFFIKVASQGHSPFIVKTTVHKIYWSTALSSISRGSSRAKLLFTKYFMDYSFWKFKILFRNLRIAFFQSILKYQFLSGKRNSKVLEISFPVGYQSTECHFLMFLSKWKLPFRKIQLFCCKTFRKGSFPKWETQFRKFEIFKFRELQRTIW